MMKEVVTSIIFFGVAFGFVSLTETQVISMEKYISVMIFLILISILTLFFFKDVIINYFKNLNWKRSLVLISISLLVHFSVSYVVINFLPRPDWPFSSKGASFLLMNNYYVWAKPLDVFVQQLFILLLVLRLSKLGLSLRNITILFIFGFGLIHIFQIFKTDLIIGLLFTIGAIVSSLVYPYMVLKKNIGFVYNFMIHLLIYNIAAVLAYTLY